MADTTPTEQSNVQAGITPVAEAPKKTETEQMPQSGQKVEIIKVTPLGLKNNETNIMGQADRRTKGALAKLDILQNITVG